MNLVHVPHCNPRCHGEEHWVEDDEPHRHPPDQAIHCFVCVVNAEHLGRPGHVEVTFHADGTSTAVYGGEP